MQSPPDVPSQTDGGALKPAPVQRHFDPPFVGRESQILASLSPEQQSWVFEQLSSTAKWERLVLQPISTANRKKLDFAIPTQYAAWKAPRLVVLPEFAAGAAKWRAEWSCNLHIMSVDSDLLSLYADISPNIFLRSEPEGQSILLFKPALSAQPVTLLQKDIIRIETDSYFEEVPFTLIVDVCRELEPTESAAWTQALGSIQCEPIVRHLSQSIVFQNDCNGTTALHELYFMHIGNALLIHVEESSQSSPAPFDSCQLYVDPAGNGQRRLFLTVANTDFVEIRPGWFLIPMSPPVVPPPAFLDEKAVLNASQSEISVQFSGKAPSAEWTATFYWQHVNLLNYCHGAKGPYFA